MTTVWKKRGFNTFNLNDCCPNDHPNRCSQIYCAKYDEDGNRIVDYVTINGVPAYKKEDGTYLYKTCEGFCDDISSLIPCNYKLTISGAVNFGLGGYSWCNECDDLNGTYFSRYESSVPPLGYSSRFYTNLCKFNSAGIGTINPSDITMACMYDDFYMYFRLAGVGNPPWRNYTRIIAVGILRAAWTDVSYSIGTSRLKNVGQWVKTVGSFDSSMIRSDKRDSGLLLPAWIFSEFDCRNFSITFSAADWMPYSLSNGSPLGYTLQHLCDLSSASFSYTPDEDQYTAFASNGEYKHLTSAPNAPCNVGTLKNMCDNEHFESLDSAWLAFTTISTGLTINISDVIGLDDNINPEDLNIDSCQKCSEINGNYRLYYNDDGTWQNVQNEAIVDCCECGGQSCIYTKFYFLTVEEDIVKGVVEFYNPLDNSTYAKFEKEINVANGLDCNGLLLDNFTLIEHAFNDGNSPYEKHRCDFSSANISVYFDNKNGLTMAERTIYDVNGTKLIQGCIEKRYRCRCCYGHVGPQYMQISIHGSFSWLDDFYWMPAGSVPGENLPPPTAPCQVIIPWYNGQMYAYFQSCGGGFASSTYILDQCERGGQGCPLGVSDPEGNVAWQFPGTCPSLGFLEAPIRDRFNPVVLPQGDYCRCDAIRYPGDYTSAGTCSWGYDSFEYHPRMLTCWPCEADSVGVNMSVGADGIYLQAGISGGANTYGRERYMPPRTVMIWQSVIPGASYPNLDWPANGPRYYADCSRSYHIDQECSNVPCQPVGAGWSYSGGGVTITPII